MIGKTVDIFVPLFADSLKELQKAHDALYYQIKIIVVQISFW